MAKIKKFIEGKVEREFDRIACIYIIMTISAVIISGAIYSYAHTPTTNALIFASVLVIIGFLFYVFAGWSGWDAIKGFLMWRKIIKNDKPTKEQKLRRSINVHLSLALYLTIATAIVVAITMFAPSAPLTSFNISAFQDIATVIPISDSIFVALIVNQQNVLGKRSMSIYQILIAGIFLSIMSLVAMGLGVSHIFIMVFITLSIFSMYFLFSVFLYFTKFVLSKKPGVAGKQG